MKNYDEPIRDINNIYRNTSKKDNMISNLRLIAAIIGIVCLIESIANKKISSFIFFVAAVLVFFILFAYHEKIRERKRYLEAKLKVFQKRNARLSNSWSDFEDKGNDFLNEETIVEKDLDIFGSNSLYQYMCTAHTQEGRKILATYLQTKEFDKQKVSLRQGAVKELIHNEEVAIELETLSMMIGNNSKSKIKDWYEDFTAYLKLDKKLIPTGIHIISILLPIITLALIVLILQANLQANLPINLPTSLVFILLFVQVIVGYFISYKNKKIISNVFSFCSNIREYYKIIKYIETIQFESEYLNSLCSKIKNNKEATRGIEKLNHLNEAFSVQSSSYIHIFLQLLFMYDIHCVVALEKWKSTYKESILNLFQIIGEMEALLSLSIIGCHKTTCFPEFLEKNSVSFEANHMSHPLIPLESVVSNSFKIQKATSVITGSNMSGKSTFMRTIGINCTLAYAGAPVCAKSMKLSYMKLFTSMRLQDDVSKGISSFYAEVLRIKQIVDYSLKNEPMLILIDEIFKGTNSADRIVGAKEILKALNKNHIICFVSTHDFELCSLVEKSEIKGSNYHFEEYYNKNEICFDYKIKDGRCKTTNAKHILRMAGLIT